MTTSLSSLPPAILALVPSAGLGGGIENYADQVLKACSQQGVEIIRLPLLSPASPQLSLRKKFGYSLRAIRESRRLRSDYSLRVWAFLPSFMFLTRLCQWVAANRSAGITIFFFGLEAWALPRRTLLFGKFFGVRPVAISSFTAGAIAGMGPARILYPSLAPSLYERLLPLAPKAPSPPLVSNSLCV